MVEPTINSTYTFKGVKYKVITPLNFTVCKDCKGKCDFCPEHFCLECDLLIDDVECSHIKCSSKDRKDKESIIFKRLQ